MSKTNIQVGDKIYVPVFSNELSEGVILHIDNDNIYDPRLKYKVCFDELNIITFFSEDFIRNWIDRNNKEIMEVKDVFSESI